MSIVDRVNALGQTDIDSHHVKACRDANLRLHYNPEWYGCHDYGYIPWYACTTEWLKEYKANGGGWNYND